MSTRSGLFKKFLLCALLALCMAIVFAGCELKDPVTESFYFIQEGEENEYNKDHTTSKQAVDEFTGSITALRKYLDSESFVDSGYYMGVDFDIDLLDVSNRTVGNFALKIQAFLYTYPHEDENGNPIYKYYENGQYYDEQNPQGTRKLVSALEIHNEAIKKSDISIEWYNGATNEVMIGLYFDGLNSNADNPGNILYVNIQGYKRSFENFGDTVMYQQLVRLLMSLSVEGLLEKLGLQGDAGTGSINETMTALVGDNFKKVFNGDVTSLLFYSVVLDAISGNVNEMLRDLLGVFERKWDPMTQKFLGFKFSTVANADVQTISADLQALISPDKQHASDVLTNAFFAFRGIVQSAGQLYNYTSNVHFDYGWTYPEELKLDMAYYNPFVYGNYEFDGTLYIPSWDAQYDALIRTQIQPYDNSKNEVFIQFTDIANGELVMGLYYHDERSYLDITGLEYLYGWIDVERLGFPKVYDEHLDLAEVLGKFFRIIDDTIVSIVDSILDPATSDKENSILKKIMDKTSFTEKILTDLFSKNTETLRVDIELVKDMLEQTGNGTYTTRQIINILDSMLPYTMDQIAIMLGISSAEVMLEKSYFTLTWDVDSNEMTIKLFTDVGVEPGMPSTMIFQLELIPVRFGEYVTIASMDFSSFNPLGEIITYSGTLKGDFVFSSQETVDLSKLLSATFGESSGLNTPYVLANNAGLSFTLKYDQIVTDHEFEGYYRKQGRSAFDLVVWLTGSESSKIITLASDDVSFNNETYKRLKYDYNDFQEDEKYDDVRDTLSQEEIQKIIRQERDDAEHAMGYVWVSIECVTKNGTQVIPKLKIREDVFMASMSAYMNNETSITDDVKSFADNDFNLSLTSIITALCEDAYVVPEPEQLEITSSNETLQNLFRVKGLIGNIKVDAGFEDRVTGLEPDKNKYDMYTVGFFENLEGVSPYYTELHKTLEVFFYTDYLAKYNPLDFDFYVFRNNVTVDDTLIKKGTMMVFELGAKKTVTRDPIEESGGSFFNSEDANNQDITKVRFMLSSLGDLIKVSEEGYTYFTYYGMMKVIDDDYIYTAVDGTTYVYWLGISDIVFHDTDDKYYYYDMSKALVNDDGDYVYIIPGTTNADRNLLFEYDPESVKITEACKTQYAPRTNGSFMGEVRRYFIRFTTNYKAELGSIEKLYHDPLLDYPEYYSEEDKNFVLEEYDDDGTLISSTPSPITLYVMEPCEPLADKVAVIVRTSSSTSEAYTFDSTFVIDWDNAVTLKGYMIVTQVIVAPGMMGETTFPVRIIVTNREIETSETAVIYYDNVSEPEKLVPVVDEISIDPYAYLLSKYSYMSDVTNLNLTKYYTDGEVAAAYNEAVEAFVNSYFSNYAFNIKFKWEESYLHNNGVKSEYIAKSYTNVLTTEVGIDYERYKWSFDKSSLGDNREDMVKPSGNLLYLHTYFHGQLIALRVNVEKRAFSHVKFGDLDSFDPDEYNADVVDSSDKIYGLYQANYYDTGSYDIARKPVFVFVDNNGRAYEYGFNMKIVSGLAKNGDRYSGNYVYYKDENGAESYSVTWGNQSVTNISTAGSYYKEYVYEQLYEASDWTTTTMSYASLRDELKKKQVKYMDESGNVRYGDLYANDNNYVRQRNVLTETRLKEILNKNGLSAQLDEYETVEYGKGKAYKYKLEDEKTYVRSESKESVNRPFYYFRNRATGERAYLSEEEYEAYLNGDETYEFVTNNGNYITTSALNFRYMFRLFYAVDNGKEMHSLSVVDNCIIDDEKTESTVFPIIMIRIEAECPVLEVKESAIVETNELTEEEFTPSVADMGDETTLGYYKVDPLKSSSFILPETAIIYFEDDNGRTTKHKFVDLEWCVKYDPDGTPVYTYTDGNGNRVPLVLKEGYEVEETYVDEYGDTRTRKVTKYRYRINIDADALTGTLKFSVMSKIGNRISGYRYITICVNVLSKDPTGIVFYAKKGEIETTKTVARVDRGETGTTQVTYYTYYANTFDDNFSLPNALDAKFSDGRSVFYGNLAWRMARETENIFFAPNSMVNVVTTIGTGSDEEGSGVEIKVYLSVIVENYSLDVNAVTLGGEYAKYYVTVQNVAGEILPEKQKISDLLRVTDNKIGFYLPGAYNAYPRISTGAASDGDVPVAKIGLYTCDENKEGKDRYSLFATVTPLEFISDLFGTARIVVEKNAFDYDKQRILSNDDFEQYYITMKDASGTAVDKRLSEVAKVTYAYDEGTQSDVISVKLYLKDAMGTYYPLVNDDKVVIKGRTSSVKITLSELVVYLTERNLSENYLDRLVTEVNGVPFSGEKLSEYVSYGVESGVIIDVPGMTENTSTVRLVNPDDATDVAVITLRELRYRAEHYLRHVRVTAGERVMLRDKDISINNLEKIMDVSDMVYRNGTSAPDGYTVSLGASAGSYDLKAELLFTGGFYLNEDSRKTLQEAIEHYESTGMAKYKDDFVFGDVKISVGGVYNDGSQATRDFRYRVSATDEILENWLVESTTMFFDGISVGDLIRSIPAEAIYKTSDEASNREITVSALTAEGFRIRRKFTIESVPALITRGYNGSKGTGFAIKDGVIKINNIYNYNVAEDFGTTSKLPQSVVVNINGKNITVSGIQWEINPKWKEKVDSGKLTYKGTDNGVDRGELMASATILGYNEYVPSLGKDVNVGGTRIDVYADIDKAEVKLLPWNERFEEVNIGLETETAYQNGKAYHIVYVDPIESIKSSAMVNANTIKLPSTISARYESGQVFKFSGVTYMFNNAYEVTTIFFNSSGMDTNAMINNDLRGYSESRLNKRYLDLSADLGLGQTLNIRFYFYDKTTAKAESSGGEYTDAQSEFRLDDETVRNVVAQAIKDSLQAYNDEILAQVNVNRIVANLEEIIRVAQVISGMAAEKIDAIPEELPLDRNIPAGSTATTFIEYVIDLIKSCSDERTIPSYEDVSLDALPKTYAYTERQAYEFARTYIKEISAQYAAEYAEKADKAIRGGGSETAKRKIIREAFRAYAETVNKEAYNEIIGEYLKGEFASIFSGIIGQMTDKEYNDTIYYKNMVEAGFDVDNLLRKIYKLRSLRSRGADVETALIQVPALRAIKAGYPVSTYSEIATALVIETLYEAFDFADEKVNASSEDMIKIRSVIQRIAEKQIVSVSLGRNFTTASFVSEYAFNESTVDGGDERKISKKFIRTYLINLISETMDFTRVKGDGSGDWEEFRNEVSSNVIGYSFGEINNFSTMINQTRKELISSSSVRTRVRTFLTTGISDFISAVYAENKYVNEIRLLRVDNGIIFTGTFSEDEFKAMLDEHKGLYLADRYRDYSSYPTSVVVYFNDGNESKGNEGGFPYVITTPSAFWSETEKGIRGAKVSELTAISTEVRLRLEIEDHALTAEERVITSALILEAADFVESAALERKTEDNAYVMTKTVRDATTVDVWFYAASDTAKTKRLYKATVLRKRKPGATDITNAVSEFFGYDSEGNVMYKFENKYDDTLTVTSQTMYVYNPFEFNKAKHLPSLIVASGEKQTVKWSNVNVNPTGNIGSNEEISGQIKSLTGAENRLTMRLFVAKWAYAGMYQVTEAITETEYEVNGVTKHFVLMNPLQFYFSQYASYSARDYYLVKFNVSIMTENEDTGEMEEQRIMLTPSGALAGVSFTQRLFYPENSRDLEYGTNDDTMAVVNERSKYMLYWDKTTMNRVINARLADVKGLVYLGNSEIGSNYSLLMLRANGDKLTPTEAGYSYEQMRIDSAQMTIVDKTDANIPSGTIKLYEDVEAGLMAKDGQISVVIGPNGYLPSTANVKLFENHISYGKDELTVRLLWNSAYDKVLRGLIEFVAFAYPDIEEAAAREDLATNILMGWNDYSESEKAEIIKKAVEYEKDLNDYIKYTDEQALLDAYELLAINEKYDYSQGARYLSGGANNSVRATVLVRVNGKTDVYAQTMKIKMLFEDCTPIKYYVFEAADGISWKYVEAKLTVDNYQQYGNGANAQPIYIGVRKQYYDDATKKTGYEIDGRPTPYDEIGSDMYKLLQIYSDHDKKDPSGGGMDGLKLIEITDIVWTYDAENNKIVSSSFVICGYEVTSRLLQITLTKND